MAAPNVEFKIICDIVGDELARKIQQQIGGCKIYIPSVSGSDRAARDALIVAEYNFGRGLTPNQLALKHQLSEPHVRKILDPKPKEKSLAVNN